MRFAAPVTSAQRPSSERAASESVKTVLRRIGWPLRLHYRHRRLARSPCRFRIRTFPFPRPRRWPRASAWRRVSATRSRTPAAGCASIATCSHALYEPGLGYYSGGSAKLGAAGDFTTASGARAAAAAGARDALRRACRRARGAGPARARRRQRGARGRVARCVSGARLPRRTLRDSRDER